MLLLYCLSFFFMCFFLFQNGYVTYPPVSASISFVVVAAALFHRNLHRNLHRPGCVQPTEEHLERSRRSQGPIATQRARKKSPGTLKHGPMMSTVPVLKTPLFCSLDKHFQSKSAVQLCTFLVPGDHFCSVRSVAEDAWM